METLIDKLGRVELPDFVRTQLGVKPGDTLLLDEQDGKWFLQPPDRSQRGETGSKDVIRSSAQARPETLLTSCNDLNWDELDYAPVPLELVAQISVRIEPAGNVKPIPHELATTGYRSSPDGQIPTMEATMRLIRHEKTNRLVRSTPQTV